MPAEHKRKQLKDYINTTLIGGFLVILPTAILLLVFNWIFRFILNSISPITKLMTFGGSVDKFIANILAIIIILLFCFGFGVLARTTFGNYFFREFENNVLFRIPFYKAISETVKQFSNREKMPFSRVVLADIFGNDTRMTGFITDEHDNDTFTLFVPTGPNPTNGFIFHVKGHQFQEIDVSVEDAMKSILGVGAGSRKLFESQLKSASKSKS